MDGWICESESQRSIECMQMRGRTLVVVYMLVYVGDTSTFVVGKSEYEDGRWWIAVGV